MIVSKTLSPRTPRTSLDHLLAQVGAGVVHGQHDALQRELLVARGGLDLLDHAQNFRQAVHREKFALQRNEDRVGRGQRVGHEDAERRRAIEQDEAVARMAAR